MLGVRYALPALLVVAGLAFLVVPAEPQWAVWGMFEGSALAVLLINVLWRMGVEGERDREREEAAREHFRVHGEWPGERRGPEPRP
jgi:chromate transport protein ChrA